MPRRVTLIVFLGFVTVLVLTTGISAGAVPGAQVQSKEAEIAAAQQRLMDIRSEQGIAEARYSDALTSMNELNGKIATATKDLNASEERLAEAQRSLEERASQVYKSGNVAFIDVMVGVNNFSEFAARMDLWLRLLGQERAEFEAVLEAKNELAAHKAKLEDQRAERVAAVEEALAQKEEVANAEAEAEAYLASLNDELRAAIQAQQEQRAKRQAQLAAQALEQQTSAQATVEAPAQATTQATTQATVQATAQATAEAPAPVADFATVEETPVVLQDDIEAQQAAANARAEAAQAAAEAAQLQAQKAAERRAAAEEAAEAAAAEAAAAQKAAAQDARQEEREQARIAAERAAARQAEREQARLEAERAARRAEIEQAAAEQAAAERAAAQRAAERQAEARQAARQAEERQAARRAEERQAARRAEERRAARQDATATATATATASATASATAPASGRRADRGVRAGGSPSAVIAEAKTHLGTPYQLGSCVPYKAEDCSCFTMLVYREFGFALPDNPGAQMGYGTPVPGGFANTQAGDLVFWAEGGGGITHVGISMGDGVNVIHASNYEGQVVIAPAQYINGYAGARRLL